MINPERELVKKLQADLYREAPRILSGLLQRSFQAASPLRPICPDVLGRICEQSIQECLGLVFQLVTPAGDAASRQPYADNSVNQGDDDRGSLNSYQRIQPWLATASPPHEFEGHPIQPDQTITSSHDPSHEQLDGGLEQNSYPDNMGPPGSAMADCYRTPFPEQPNGGIVQDQLDPDWGLLEPEFSPLNFDVLQLYDFVNQNTSFCDSTHVMQ